MMAIIGGTVLLPDRVAHGATVVLDQGRVTAVDPAGRSSCEQSSDQTLDATGCLVAPGFVDVHVHGVCGHDVLDSEGAVAAVAEALPQFGVTAFCPTSVACGPDALRRFLQGVARARTHPPAGARVLPAHLESNFINPAFAGAQPVDCLRRPPQGPVEQRELAGSFSGADVLSVVREFASSVGIVTVAPELEGGLDLVRELVALGFRVSLGHSGADYETAVAAIRAGASHATHVFNRMMPLSHRAPGLVGAILESPEVTAELIGDGIHVHPAMCRLVITCKGPGGVMAITDGTAGAGLPTGATARLGGRRIHVRGDCAELDDGTMAGSVATMNRVFEMLVTHTGVPLVDAARMCATTPARQLGLVDGGVIAEGAVGDLVVLEPSFAVRYTIVGGTVLYSSRSPVA